MPLRAQELELRRMVLLMGNLRLGASLTVLGRSDVAAFRRRWIARGWLDRAGRLTRAGRARFRATSGTRSDGPRDRRS